jgi:hypothetical protein
VSNQGSDANLTRSYETRVDIFLPAHPRA